MTFSLVARCDRTGQFGIAISSSSPAVAARCAHVQAGTGAVASQSITDPALGGGQPAGGPCGAAGAGRCLPCRDGPSGRPADGRAAGQVARSRSAASSPSPRSCRRSCAAASSSAFRRWSSGRDPPRRVTGNRFGIANASACRRGARPEPPNSCARIGGPVQGCAETGMRRA